MSLGRPLIAAIGALLLSWGGSVGCDAPPQEVVGLFCAENDDCDGLEDAFCTMGGVCSKTCGTHSDCGCPAGTTDAVINAGDCQARCSVDGSEDATGAGLCYRACSYDGHCDGGLVCKFGPLDPVGHCL